LQLTLRIIVPSLTLTLKRRKISNLWSTTNVITTFEVRIAQSLVSCVVFCRLLCVFLSFGHCIVCPSTYGFWLPRWYLQTVLIFIEWIQYHRISLSFRLTRTIRTAQSYCTGTTGPLSIHFSRHSEILMVFFIISKGCNWRSEL
jgi:hypothetical protein